MGLSKIWAKYEENLRQRNYILSFVSFPIGFRCAAHAEQLAVNDFLKDSDIKHIINHVRRTVTTLRTQNLRIALEREKCPVVFPLDNDTRYVSVVYKKSDGLRWRSSKQIKLEKKNFHFDYVYHQYWSCIISTYSVMHVLLAKAISLKANWCLQKQLSTMIYARNWIQLTLRTS